MAKSRIHGPSSLPRVLLLAALVVPLTTFLPTASASTSVTSQRASAVAISVRSSSPSPAVSVIGNATVLVAARVPGPTQVAGTQTAGTIGLSGTTALLAGCRAGPCARQYRPAGAAALTVGHWAVEVRLAVSQPAVRLGASSGFAVEVAFHLTVGWVVAWGYFSTGTTRAATNQTVDVNVWVDLGTTIRPTSVPLELVLDRCSAATRCP